MNQTDCETERLSSRTVGVIITAFSLLLLVAGLILLPVIGFIFAIPILILGLGMIMSPDSKTCQLIMSGLRTKK
jgi:hypothetical protein